MKSNGLCEMRLRWETRAAPDIKGHMCVGCAMERGLLGVGYALFYDNGDVLRVVKLVRTDAPVVNEKMPHTQGSRAGVGVEMDDDEYHYNIFMR